MARNIPVVTGLRGVAAFYVVAFHAVFILSLSGPAWDHPLSRYLMAHGWIGVDFFFVLSGFLLSMPLLEGRARLRDGGFWRTYLLKRFLRIAPPYYVSILAIALLVGSMPWFAVTPVDLAIHLAYLHNFWKLSLLAINPVYWTLAVELQFYLVLPFLVQPFRTRAWPLWLAAAAAITVAWRAWAWQPGDTFTSNWLAAQVPGYLVHFALGICAARLYLRGWRPRAGADLWAATATAACIALPLDLFSYAGSLQGADRLLWHMVLRPLVAVGFAGVLLVLVSGPSMLGRLLSTGVFQHAGAISYSVYLLHFPLAFWLVTLLPALLHVGLPALMAVLVAFAWLGGWAFYALVERPSLRLKDRWTRPAHAPTLPVSPQD